MEDMRNTVGELFDQIDNIIQENGENSHATKAMIKELGCTFGGEICSLPQDLSEL